MADELDFLDGLNGTPRRRVRPRPIAKPDSGWFVFVAVLLFVGVVILAGGLSYRFIFSPRPAEPVLTPAEKQAAEWPGGPKTYTEAATLLETESATLGRLRLSRLLARRDRDAAVEASGFIPAGPEGNATRERLNRLDSEVAEWEREVSEQERKVERARLRKEALDR